MKDKNATGSEDKGKDLRTWQTTIRLSEKERLLINDLLIDSIKEDNRKSISEVIGDAIVFYNEYKDCEK